MKKLILLIAMSISANAFANTPGRIVYGIGNPDNGSYIFSTTAIAALDSKCHRLNLSKVSCEDLNIKNSNDTAVLRNAVICTGLCRD